MYLSDYAEYFNFQLFPRCLAWVELYRMQLNAPVPLPVICEHDPIDKPPYLGRDFHGSISHVQAAKLLCGKQNGSYLVRSSKIAKGEFYTLSLKFDDKIHHYKLYHDPASGLYVRDKRYDCVRSLVADGLVTMYLQLKAPLTLQRLPTANYQESPYMTLNKRKLRVLTKEYARNSEISSSNLFSPPQSTTYQKKSHVFKVTTFKGLNWCELCGNFLWGFTAQGVKCDDCGMIAHVVCNKIVKAIIIAGNHQWCSHFVTTHSYREGKCSEKFPEDCVPDLKNLRGVFGIELTTLLTAYNAILPFVVTKCVAEVEARGLTVEGIYRLSGFQDEIEAIKMALDKDGDKADLSQEKCPNINVITGALKLYLRVLPIPLITFYVHPLLINTLALKKTNAIISSIRHALASLPKAHYDTLKFVIEHLKRVSQHAAINKMNPHNLATVFAPTLIGPPEISTNMMPDITSDIILIENIISYSDEIFSDGRSILV